MVKANCVLHWYIYGMILCRIVALEHNDIKVGLPRSKYGCPDQMTTKWTPGSIDFIHQYKKTQDGIATDQEFRLNICGLVGQQLWPPGQYCIFRYGDSCPDGFTQEYVTLSAPTTSSVSLAGKLPLTVLQDITVKFCCHDNTDPAISIAMPFKTPFILLPMSGHPCQSVLGFTHNVEAFYEGSMDVVNQSTSTPWVTLDTIRFRPTICNYQPIEQLFDPCEPGWEAFDNFCYQFHWESTTWEEADKVCRLTGSSMYSVHSWQELSYITNMTLYMRTVFPRPRQSDYENYWSGLNDFEVEGVWSYSDGTPSDAHLIDWSDGEPNDWLSGEDCLEWRVNTAQNNDNSCWKPRRSICKKPRLSVVEEVAYGKPTRQSSTEGELESSLAVDSKLSATCAQTSDTGDLWWQINLQEVHTVYGIQIVTGTNFQGLLTVTVSPLPEDFLNQQALICVDKFLTTQRVTMHRCLQPIRGQFVTIQVVTSENLGDRNIDFSPYLSLCNVMVYGEGTSCGLPLGLGTGEISSVDITASSYSDVNFPHMARHSTSGSWCASPNDSQPYIQIEMDTEHVIYGLEVQGGNSTHYISQFQLALVKGDATISFYQEYDGINKVFYSPGNGKSTLHILHDTLMTKNLRILVLAYVGAPCLQLELMECKAPGIAGSCPQSVGAPAVNFSRVAKTSSAIITGNIFPCDATIIGIRLFSLDLNYSMTIAIWRKRDSSLVLDLTAFLHISVVSAGFQYFEFEQNIQVKSGDFLGIHVDMRIGQSLHFPIPFAVKGKDGILPSDLHTVMYMDWVPGKLAVGQVLNISSVPVNNMERLESAMAIEMQLVSGQEIENVCKSTIISEGLIHSPNYPSYYGSYLACVWRIIAPPDKFVRINFYNIDLTPEDSGTTTSCPLAGGFSTSPCGDTLTVSTFTDETFIINDMTNTIRVFQHQDNALIISDTSYVQLELDTCIRTTPMEAKGFQAEVIFTDYYGCCIGQRGTTNCECLSYSHGYIASVSYPFMYQSNLATDWTIMVESGNYIELIVEEMDIASKDASCQEDYLTVRDTSYTGEVMGEALVFCNHDKPITGIKSSWHFLSVHFYSDATIMGRGFLAKYESKTFLIEETLEKRIEYKDYGTKCHEGEVLFNHFCYKFSQSEQPIVWIDAESACETQGGYLVSIMSEEEMKVLHYLLTTIWRTERRETYIGLFDKNPRSQFWWTDSRPLIYSAWSPKQGDTALQPDGADLEACTMIQLSNLHSINHWHDIPCSTDSVYQYICKSQAAGFVGSLSEADGLKLINYGECPPELFTCGSGGCIQITHVCNGFEDCQDGLDEYNCTTECSPTQFQCGDGQCIQMSKYCDFLTDCQDGSDETSCVYPSCTPTEWKCGNGQCIPLEKRCNVIEDCVDKSDELEEHCTFCSSVNTMQCFWGKCIPQHTWCDTMVDCAGVVAEDEAGCEHTRAQTCGDIRVMGYPSGHYRVRPRLLDQIDVLCRHSEHTTWTDITSTGFERTVTLEISEMALFQENYAMRQQVEYIMEGADTCWQHIQLVCEPGFCLSAITLASVEGSINEIDVSNWNCSCTTLGDGTDSATSDEFNIYETNLLTKSILYIKGSYTSEENGTDNLGHILAHPIQCREDTVNREWPPWFQCKSGQYIESKHRCILEFNEYGFPLGCRDMSHLLGCDKYHELDRECFHLGRVNPYGGSTSRSSEGRTCQRWDAQAPHRHTFREIRQLGALTLSEVENYCRTPRFGDLPVPFCFVADPEESILSNCENPPCVPAPFAEWEGLGIAIPYEVPIFPCEVPYCDPSVVNKTLPFECPEFYISCPGHYCIPERYVCDGQWHCPNGEDETQCEDFTCQGMYRCQNQPNCLPTNQVCDGINQCLQGDDELYCDVTCPKGCICTGYTYNCSGVGFNQFPSSMIVNHVRKLDLSSNKIHPNVNDLKSYGFLGELNLSSNGIKTLENGTFLQQMNLYSLDISNNSLEFLTAGVFLGLRNLKALFIHQNLLLRSIEPGTFEGLHILTKLEMEGLSLTHILDNTFEGLFELKSLSLAHNKIDYLDNLAFSKVTNLESLDLSGNPLSVAGKSTFQEINSLRYLTSDSFKFCCFASQVPSKNCLPPQDEISSCSDLMKNNILRSFLWLLGTLAFVGNTFVIFWRSNFSSSTVSELSILHLGVADFLMGMYMLCIGIVDAYYRGVYIEYADQWRMGIGCQILGFLATFSSEGSVLFLCLITIDRFINIVFPFGNFKISHHSAKLLISMIWFIALILSGIPLCPIAYFQGQFYSRSGVCLALPITAETPPGWEYSTILFIGFNLVGFLLIFICYSIMYMVIHKAGKKARRGKSKAQLTLARNMMLIVMTDFVCWLPIIIMGFLALYGYQLSGEVYAWTIVFIMPVNSALNPILYTISSLKIKEKLFPDKSKKSNKSMIKKIKQTGTDVSMGDYVFGVPTFNQDTDTLAVFLKAKKLTIIQLLNLFKTITGTVHALHTWGMVHGNLSFDTVIVNTSQGGFSLFTKGFAFDDASDELDPSDDMEMLGHMLKTMLRGVGQLNSKPVY